MAQFLGPLQTIGDLEEVSHSQLQISSVLAFPEIWRGNQQIKVLVFCFSCSQWKICFQIKISSSWIKTHKPLFLWAIIVWIWISCHLKCQDWTGDPVWVCMLHFQSNSLHKIIHQKLPQVLGLCPPWGRPGWGPLLLVSAWLLPGCCSPLSNGPAHGRSPLPLHVCLYYCPIC